MVWGHYQQKHGYEQLLQFYRHPVILWLSVLAREFSKCLARCEFVIQELPTELRGNLFLYYFKILNNNAFSYVLI